MLEKILTWLLKKNLEPESKISLQDQEYKKIAEDSLEKALTLINSDGWKKEKIEGEDAIYTKVVPLYGKIFKFVGVVHMSPEKVLDELYFKIEDMHKWNPTVKKARIIQRIDDHIDIAHVIAAEGAAGLVASRDFINIRIWKKFGDGYVHGTVGTTHSNVPTIAKYVRGEQGPGAYIITRGPTPDQCELQWLLNTNLKGWIPQYLIDQTLSTVMLEYIYSLRRYHAKPKLPKTNSH